jgi:hypothetical protein
MVGISLISWVVSWHLTSCQLLSIALICSSICFSLKKSVRRTCQLLWYFLFGWFCVHIIQMRLRPEFWEQHGHLGFLTSFFIISRHLVMLLLNLITYNFIMILSMSVFARIMLMWYIRNSLFFIITLLQQEDRLVSSIRKVRFRLKEKQNTFFIIFTYFNTLDDDKILIIKASCLLFRNNSSDVLLKSSLSHHYLY